MLYTCKSHIKTNVKDCYFLNESFFVELEHTIFYPTSGGQSHDSGYINNCRVLDVFYDDDKIIHKIDKPVSGCVSCTLDLKVRFKNSALHTAQHLFSAIALQENIETDSFSMTDNSFSIDVIGQHTKQKLNQLENLVNKAIRDGAKVYSRKYDANKDSLICTSKINKPKNQINLVIIEGYDKNACGGTHLENIKLLEYFKIIKWKNYKDRVRIKVLIGNDAINYVNDFFDNYNQVIKLVNQPQENVLEFIENKLKENKKLQKQQKRMLKQVTNV